MHAPPTPASSTLRAEAPDDEGLQGHPVWLTDPELNGGAVAVMKTSLTNPAQQRDMHMAGPPRYPDTGGGPDRAATTGTSRWQKVVGIIGLLVLLWVGNQMVGQLAGRGPGLGGMDHGPGQDAPPAEIQEPEPDGEDGGGH